MMIAEFKDKYAFLSNFYPSKIVYKGIEFDTAEHAFQAAKAKHDDEMLWVASAPTPGKAKYRGRQVTLREDWEHMKLHEMLNIVEIKFSELQLADLLQNTRNRPLSEGNYWHDQFWGNCLCDQHKSTSGRNYLGKILMYIRDRPI